MNGEHAQVKTSCKGSRLILIATLIVSFAFALFGCGEKKDINKDWQAMTTTVNVSESGIQDETTLPSDQGWESELPAESTALEKITDVATKYGNFKLAGHWDGDLEVEIVEGTAYVIRAYCNTALKGKSHLFDVTFGAGSGEFMGYASDINGIYAPVYIELGAVEPDDSWPEEEVRDYFGMQGEINSILSQLDLVDHDPTAQTDSGVVEIKTSYFSLFYPSKYGNRVRAEVEEGETVTVTFYGTPEGMEELLLFKILLNGNSEMPVGLYTIADGRQIPVDIGSFGEYDTTGWTEEASRQLSEMLESINDILSALEQTGNFQY